MFFFCVCFILYLKFLDIKYFLNSSNDFSWIPTCAKMCLDKKDLWHHLLPQYNSQSEEYIRGFFSTVASLMSLQLREMVINSLADFLAFFEIHKVWVQLIRFFLCYKFFMSVEYQLLDNDIKQYSNISSSYWLDQCLPMLGSFFFFLTVV